MMIIPEGVQPGQTFQLAFLTQGVIDAQSSDIDVYNDFVATAATTAGLSVVNGQPVVWTAIFSTASVDARDNTPQTSPVYDVLGQLILAIPYGLFADAPNFLENPINTTEYGDVLASAYVWTGSNWDGTSNLGFSLGPDAQFVAIGNSSSIFPTWLNTAYWVSGAPLHLYALSSPITVPVDDQNPDPGGGQGNPGTVPETASFRLGILGLTSILGRLTFRRWNPFRRNRMK
jgi:hypothetical protein